MTGAAATRPLRLRVHGVVQRAEHDAGGAALLLAVVVAAVAIGTLAAVRPMLAVGVVIGGAMLLLLAANVNALPPILVVTMFAEGVSVGGIHIGRVVGVFALAFIAYYLLVQGRADVQSSFLLAVGLSYGLWVLVSVYWAPDDHLVYVTFLKWALSFAFMLCFAVLVREERHLKAVLASFVFAAVAFGAVAIADYALSAGTVRGTGLEGDPNQFAAYQAIAVPAALVLAAVESRPHVRLAYQAAVGVIVVSIAASFSRGGLVTLAVIVAGTLVVPWSTFFRRRSEKMTYIFALAAAGWAIALLGSTQYLTRIESIFGGSDRGSGRTDLWAAAWSGYTHQPYLGLGAGGFQAQSLDLLHNTPGVNIQASYVRPLREVHNSYLEALTDLGPVGLALFLSLLTLTLLYLARSQRRFREAGARAASRYTAALMLSTSGLAVATIFLSYQFGRALWIFVGLALALDRMSSRTRAGDA